MVTQADTVDALADRLDVTPTPSAWKAFKPRLKVFRGWRPESFEDERLRAALEAFVVERSRRGGSGADWEQRADQYVVLALDHETKGEVDAAWTLLKAGQRELIRGFDEAELNAARIRVKSEAGKKLSGWRSAAVENILDPKTPPSVEVLRASVIEAQQIVDEQTDNVYRRLRILRLHVRQALIQLGAVLLVLIGVLSQGFGAITDGPFFADGRRVFFVMVLGALGAALSGIVAPLTRNRDEKLPDALSQSFLAFVRPFVGAAAAVVVVAVARSDIAGLKIDPEAVPVVAIAAGFSERLVGQSVSSVSAALRGGREVPTTGS